MGLAAVCGAPGEWGAQWLDIAPQHVDPYLALWSMTKSLNADCVTDGRVVVRFDFPGQLFVATRNTWQLTPSIAQQFTHDAADWHANEAETSLLLCLAPQSVWLKPIPTATKNERMPMAARIRSIRTGSFSL